MGWFKHFVLATLAISFLFLPRQTFAGPDSQVDPVELLPQESGENYVLAKRKSRRRSKRSRRRKARGTRVHEGWKGNLGFAMGDGDNSIAFGADYVMRMKRLIKAVPYAVSLTGGFTYWSKTGLTVMIFDGGADYYWSINKRFRVFAGARLGYARITVDNALVSGTDTDVFLQPDAGVEYRLKRNMSVGGEFRMPLGDYDINLLNAFVKYKF